MTDFYNKLSEEDKHTGSPNSLWVRFRTALETGIGKYIPHRSTSKLDRHPWMSRDLKKMIRKQKEAFTRKRRHPNRANTDKYKHLQAKVQKKFRQEYWTYVNNILTPDPGQNGHTPKRPHPKRPQLFWLPKRPQPKRPHCIGQNGHTGRITTKTAKLHLVKTATKGGSLPKRPHYIWSKRPQREDHYQNGHTAFGQNGRTGKTTTKTATLHLVKTATQERPLPKRPHCIWSKRPHREGDHWISCQASVTHAGVLARMQQGPFLGRY